MKQMLIYREYRSVTEKSLALDCREDLDLLFKWLEFLALELESLIEGFSEFGLESMKKAGSDGIARLKEELLSMRTTEPMVGLSEASSWTHNRPMWMHLIMSRRESEPSLNVEAIKLETVPSFQHFHAWKHMRNHVL